MKSSNLQLRKMTLIEILISIQDEQVFSQLESSIQAQLKLLKPKDVAFSKRDLIERAEFSNEQIINGFVTSQKDLEDQSEIW